ncbi:MAG: hypothetical protein ALECFALPRED_003464 [Alectoria fallacina]|uniref:Xylanolytic transcriptional activator regulatory domain-containing protein n=1 Tax=Alectoria fallacina TaxID=1903189 RepID=A0A8H3FIE7_9LECA|nr:MAG: hypothetical protein ALECFALPRED_003464 [Alectoria fallacina]
MSEAQIQGALQLCMCDGGMPNCSTCTAVYQTPCFYDVDSDHRRKAALKRDIETLKGQNDALGIIVASIRSSTDAEVAEIVQQIRADEDLDNIAESLKKNVMLHDRSGAKSAEGELSNLLGRPSIDASGVVKHYGHTSSLSLVCDGERSPMHLQTSEAWTKVTRDAAFVEHLLSLYFCWAHPYYVLFSKELFLDDMAKGQSKYCSPLMVNALLAFACAYSDRPEARENQSDPRTAGDHFFAEAKRLLYDNESSNLTTVQALALMGLREASCSRDSSGFQYAGRCIRMLIELGLHLSFAPASDKISPTELEVRRITFWGCFINDTTWSICIGRIAQLPRTAISLDLPNVMEQHDQKPWRPYTDYGVMNIPGAEQPTLATILMRAMSSLSEIVNDTVFMFYAPRERFTSKKLLDFYARYTRWFNNLPNKLGLRDDSTPHILLLHAYYHTVVLHLFRPFLKVDLKNSQVSPRDICTSCARKAASLFGTYRQIFGLRRVPLIATHILLSTSIIHLLNLPNASSARDLALSITCLREISANHAFANRSLDIVMALSQQWNIHLPSEVAQMAYDLPPEVPMSLLDPQRCGSATTYLSSVSDHSQQQDHIHTRDVANGFPFSAVINSPRPFATPADMFWSPFTDHSVPLQAHQQNDPMDISAMLDVPNNDFDQLSRDGFRVAQFEDPFLGPPAYNHINDHWTQA